jgi:hypothetical protein
MPKQDLSCKNTFILVAPDCRAEAGATPKARVDAPTVAEIQYKMLTDHPYRYTQEEVLFESHVRRSGLSAVEIKRRRKELWGEFFSKSQACLRASPLAKTYGWGIHFNEEGKGALVARESKQYAALARPKKNGPTLFFAMRNKRAAR